ncbi:MAG: hypothetical protein GY862_38395 [Gammaproteobacteria bacterium]|nr:hypothetical protein [Gammaproteobacteria bacterium]
MGIEQLILRKLHSLSEDQQYAILGYIQHLLAAPVQAKPFPLTRLEEGVGCTGYNGPRKSLKDMRECIETEARRQWQREDRA